MKTEGYKVGRKNNWRRWTWNRITENLDVPVSEAVGLYLPAEEDLDRVVAKSKGFRGQNLIAVDICGTAVGNVKNKGVPAIEAKVQDIIYTWTEPKLDFIFADFCHGFTKNAVEFSLSLFESSGIKLGTVIALNLLRGRDPSKRLKKWKDLYATDIHRFHGDYLTSEIGNTNLHRGWMFLQWMYQCFAKMSGWNSSLLSHDENVVRMDEVIRLTSPRMNSYKSGVLTMDSLVFRWPFDQDEVQKNWKTKSSYIPPKGLTQKIAALKAVRTMRGGCGIGKMKIGVYG